MCKKTSVYMAILIHTRSLPRKSTTYSANNNTLIYAPYEAMFK